MPQIVRIENIVFDPAIYARIKPSVHDIKRYAELIASGTRFPPIVVDQRYRILDGYHRWQAHLKCGLPEIEVEIRSVADNREALLVACMLNATQGIQLTDRERKQNAVRLYRMTCQNYKPPSKEQVREIARAAGITERTLYRWTEDIRQQLKRERNERVKQLRAEGKTPQEIARILKIPRRTVADIEISAKKRQLSLPARDQERKHKPLDFKSMEAAVNTPSPEAMQGFIAEYNRKKAEKKKYGISLETYQYFRKEIETEVSRICAAIDHLADKTAFLASVQEEKFVFEINTLLKKLFLKVFNLYHTHQFITGMAGLPENQHQLDILRKIVKLLSKKFQEGK